MSSSDSGFGFTGRSLNSCLFLFYLNMLRRERYHFCTSKSRLRFRRVYLVLTNGEPYACLAYLRDFSTTYGLIRMLSRKYLTRGILLCYSPPCLPIKIPACPYRCNLRLLLFPPLTTVH